MATFAAKPGPRLDHRFYLIVSLVLALIVFIGFAPTYYLKGFFHGSPLPLLVQLHGFVMTLWYALFIVQISLASTGRFALH